MQKRGIALKDIAASLYFALNQGANFFMEIAKLRALRQVWAAIMEAYGAEEADRAVMVHGRSSRFTKTVIDPYVNMLRNCTQTFSSVVGGIDSNVKAVSEEKYIPAVNAKRFPLRKRLSVEELVQGVRCLQKYAERVNHIFEVLGLSLFECYDMTERFYKEVKNYNGDK